MEYHDRKDCSDRIAMVPTTAAADSIFRNGVGGEKAILLDNLVPAFYIVRDDDEADETPLIKHSAGDFYYKQRRQVKGLDKAGRESFHDGYKSEVGAFSPFHLSDLMSSVNNKSNHVTCPFGGYVEGSLSNKGGMHRMYRQRVHLMLGMPRSNNDTPLGLGSKININATIFLPISESVFIDADDPLNVEYVDGSSERMFCKISVDKSKMSQMNSTRCSIQFVSPEKIDIEQPSFASRQYVVAYELSADFDLLAMNEISEDHLEIFVEYSTTLHLRYPPPIPNVLHQAGNDGMVPIVIQQPDLYSVSAALGNQDKVIDQLYVRQTGFNTTTFREEASTSRDAIIIRVAAGVDSDHKWVTIVTLSLALLGGFLLLKFLDSISIWC